MATEVKLLAGHSSSFTPVLWSKMLYFCYLWPAVIRVWKGILTMGCLESRSAPRSGSWHTQPFSGSQRELRWVIDQFTSCQFAYSYNSTYKCWCVFSPFLLQWEAETAWPAVLVSDMTQLSSAALLKYYLFYKNNMIMNQPSYRYLAYPQGYLRYPYRYIGWSFPVYLQGSLLPPAPEYTVLQVPSVCVRVLSLLPGYGLTCMCIEVSIKYWWWHRFL